MKVETKEEYVVQTLHKDVWIDASSYHNYSDAKDNMDWRNGYNYGSYECRIVKRTSIVVSSDEVLE